MTLKWLPPIPVNVTGVDDLTTTVRDVGSFWLMEQCQVAKGHSQQRSRQTVSCVSAIDHPRYAELVNEHAKTQCPEGFLSRHLHLALFCEHFEDSICLLRYGDVEQNAEALRFLIARRATSPPVKIWSPRANVAWRILSRQSSSVRPWENPRTTSSSRT